MAEGDRVEIPYNKQDMTLSSEPVGAMLTELHTAVRAALAAPQSANTAPLRRNPKGDVSQSFDLTAELCAQGFLRRQEPQGLLLSEESGALFPGSLPWITGMVAATGFILVSYVTKEFALRHRTDYPHDFLDRVKHRDLRMLSLAAGAVIGFAFEALMLVGVLSHAVVAGIMVRGWRLSSIPTGAPDEAKTGHRYTRVVSAQDRLIARGKR